MTELLIALVVFLASFTQGVVGFGFGLVTMAFLPLIVAETFAIPFVAVYGTVVSVLIAWQLRARLAWRHALPLIIGTALGVPLGVLVVTSANPLHIKLVLGVVLVAYTVWALFFANVKEVHVHDGWGYLAGISSGVLGAFNTGGPPLVVYTTLVRWEKDLTTSTLQVVFVLTGIIQLIGFAFMPAQDGTLLLNGDVFLKNLFYAPAMIAGVLLGHALYKRIDQVTFRRVLLSVLMVVGVVYIQMSLSHL